MNIETRKRFERLLRQQLDHVNQALVEETRGLPASTDEPGDDVDRLNSHMMNSLHVKMLERQIQARDRTVRALDRMRNGTFGDCLVCGDAIEEARLNALPTATLCVCCMEGREFLQKTYFMKVGT